MSGPRRSTGSTNSSSSPINNIVAPSSNERNMGRNNSGVGGIVVDIGGSSSNSIGSIGSTGGIVGGGSNGVGRRSRSNSPSTVIRTTTRRTVTTATTSIRGSSMNGSSSSSSGRNKYNNNKKDFNPKLIFSQIVALQCFHYLILGFFIQINSVLYKNSTVSIDHIFTDKYFHLHSLSGWADNFAVLLSSCVGSVLLAIIVEKSKKCLDFGVTLFLIHFMVCTLYNGIPSTWDWWIIHIFGTIVMILLGEYLCSRRELDDIPLLQL